MLSRCICESVTKYQVAGGLNNGGVFSQVLEAGSLRTECQHGQVLVTSLSGLWMASFSLHPLMLEREEGRGSSGFLGFPLRVLIPL